MSAKAISTVLCIQGWYDKTPARNEIILTIAVDLVFVKSAARLLLGSTHQRGHEILARGKFLVGSLLSIVKLCQISLKGSTSVMKALQRSGEPWFGKEFGAQHHNEDTVLKDCLQSFLITQAPRQLNLCLVMTLEGVSLPKACPRHNIQE